MLELDIPGYGKLSLRHLVLDVNGTLTLAGDLLPGVAESLAAVRGSFDVTAVTADTRGTAAALSGSLGIEVRVIAGSWEAGEKLAVIEELEPDSVVVIGNGANDALALSACAVGICVIEPEGAARPALDAADLVVTDINQALGLLADPARLVATLRR